MFFFLGVRESKVVVSLTIRGCERKDDGRGCFMSCGESGGDNPDV